MKRILLIAAMIVLGTMTLSAQTTVLIYQGSLNSGSGLANGNHDFEFLLFDGGGTQLGPTITQNGVAVTNGIFAVSLDFGNVFPGAGRFLEIHVRTSGAGAFTTLSPRQPLTSTPYSVKSLSADSAANATNATNAITATSFTGNLNGDVTGTQGTTTVARLQGRNVANTAPLNDQVLKFNAAANQWLPGTDNTGSGGGGGTITGVTPGTGLTGGGASGNVTLSIANAGVGTTQLADGSVTDVKINSVSGAKITGPVANATNAANAINATNFTGNLAGDVTGTQGATTVARLQSRNVATTTPLGGQVLKYNGSTNQWEPDTDIVGTGGGGGGTITGVSPGSGLTGGGTSGTVTVGIALGGVTQTELATNAVTTQKLADGSVTTAKLADASVTNAKIADVAGSKITGSITTATIPGANVNGPVANATNSTTAVNFSGPLAGDVTGTQNATALANNAVTTAKISDSAVTASKVAAGQVVKNINGLTDSVTLTAGSNVTITPAGNTLTIASTGGGGVGGSGTVTTIPVWTGPTTLGTSQISQSAAGVQLPANVQLAAVGNGGQVQFGSPTGETGMTIQGATGRADIRFGGFEVLGNSNVSLKLLAGPPGEIPPDTNGIVISKSGLVGVGTSLPSAKLEVAGGFVARRTDTDTVGAAINGRSVNSIGVRGISGTESGAVIGGTLGVYGFSATGTGVYGGTAGGGYAGYFNGRLSTTGNVGVGVDTPAREFHVNGRARISSIPVDGVTFGPVCFNQAGDLLQCNGSGSSLKWKTNVHRYSDGLNILRKLKPISFNWKEGGTYDIGLAAEDVAKAAPYFAVKNKEGVVEAVRYERLNMVLINAVKEQQALIDGQSGRLAKMEAQLRRQDVAITQLQNLLKRQYSKRKKRK